jgi:hypothetical protein
MRDNPLVFTVLKADVSRLGRDLRDPTVLTFDVSKVKRVVLKGWNKSAGEVLTLDLERPQLAGPWVGKEPKDFAVDEKKLITFLAGLSNLRASKLLPEKPDPSKHGLDPKEDALSLEVVVEAPPEHWWQPSEKRLTLTIGKLDAEGSGYYVTGGRLGNGLALIAKGTPELEGVRGGRGYLKKP